MSGPGSSGGAGGAGGALAVEVRGVGLVLGGRTVLRGVDLLVARGERVALVGPSGAGKSSLLRLCGGALAPTTGAVRLLGEDPRALPAARLRRLRRRIGTVHQRLDLVGPLRVVHNVNAGRLGEWGTLRALRSLVRPVDAGVAREALGRVGLAGELMQRTDRLSGGEQQRVALARVLVQRPELVLADEPVSSLDPGHRESVMRLLAEVVTGPGRALVVSLHDLDLAQRWCTRVVGLRHGAVLFDLPPARVGERHRELLYRVDG
ncbi:phosphonate ABC transporter ATP-binding protein [Kineococcus gypseus]|uniref:phosphonate ABC transporter ATP-binding protein n=1 Tax=Kineococcus gypseus TaxID=1637102 RepID=UPI003D7F0F88